MATTIRGSDNFDTDVDKLSKVLQVVKGGSATSVTVTGTSAVSTGVTATITPKQANSLIVVQFSGPFRRNSGSAWGIETQLYKDGSFYRHFTRGVFYGLNATLSGVVSATHTETVSSTSPITYAVYFASQYDSTVIFSPDGGEEGTITIWEIAQ